MRLLRELHILDSLAKDSTAFAASFRGTIGRTLHEKSRDSKAKARLLDRAMQLEVDLDVPAGTCPSAVLILALQWHAVFCY